MEKSTQLMLPKKELMSLDKKGLEERAKQIVDEIADSGWGVLKPLAIAKRMHFVAEILVKGLKEKGVNELRQESKGEKMLDGVQMSQEETGVQYFYDSDQVWQRLRDEELAWAAKRKEWEAKLKAIKSLEGQFMVDESSGEEYLAHRPARKSSESIKLSIV